VSSLAGHPKGIIWMPRVKKLIGVVFFAAWLASPPTACCPRGGCDETLG
jgi:hypothetical protein